MYIGEAYIYNEHTAKEFLYSLGFDDFDIEQLILFLTNSEDKIEYLEEMVDYYKGQAEGEFETRHSLISEIQETADKLKTGKGGTKVQYAEKLHRLCEEYS